MSMLGLEVVLEVSMLTQLLCLRLMLKALLGNLYNQTRIGKKNNGN
jgi:predicted component of type VI protein secretion system